MLGAAQASEVSVEDTNRVNGLKDAINTKAGKNSESYTVIKVSHQVVAGTNHFYVLEAKPDGSKLTVTVFEPLPHTNAPCEGENTLEIGHGK